MLHIRVAVLAFEGVSLFHLSVPGMVLGTAQPAPDGPRYEINYCAEVPGVISTDQDIGLSVSLGLELMETCDIIIIPAWGDQSLVASPQLVEALQLANAQGKLIVGLCLGAFVLGDAGLLDGKEATTTSNLIPMLRQQAPKVKVVDDRRFVDTERSSPQLGYRLASMAHSM